MFLIVCKSFNGFPSEYYELEDLAKALCDPRNQQVALYQKFGIDDKRVLLEAFRQQEGFEFSVKVHINIF